MSLHIVVDVNLNFPGIGSVLQILLQQELQPLRDSVAELKESIMGALEDLQAKVDEVNAQITEANAKTDALILVANTTKDALVALQNAGGATAEQLAELTAKLQTGIDALNAQDAETDAAAGAVAP